MARIVTCGFEANDLDYEVDQVGNNPSAVSTNPRTGTYHANIPDNDAVQWFFRSAYTACDGVYVGFGYYMTSILGRNDRDICQFRCQNGQAEGHVRILENGHVAVYRVGALLATSANPIVASADEWMYFEVYWVQHETAGVFVVKLNGVEYINETALDTYLNNPATNPVTAFAVVGIRSNTFADDVVLNDISGAVNNSWPGVIHLLRATPSADDAVTWSNTGGGSNYQDVDGAVDDGEWVYNDVADDEDVYDVTDVTSSVPTDATIKNIVAVCRAKVDTGSEDMRVLVGDGTTIEEGPTVGLSEAWARLEHVVDDKPSGGAWARSDLVNLQVGVKVK